MVMQQPATLAGNQPVEGSTPSSSATTHGCPQCESNGNNQHTHLLILNRVETEFGPMEGVPFIL